MAGVIGYEVAVRYGFDSPTIWGTQLAQMIFGTYVVLGGAYALRYRVHVNMDAIYARLSPRKKATIDVVTSMAFFFAIGFLLWQGGILAWEAVMKWETSVVTPWRQPIWPVKLMIPIGALLILLQGLAKFIRDFHLAITGRELV